MKKIMIVDDEPYIVDILSFLFKENGWDVCGIKNGQLALESIQEFRPEVIISDINMPVLNGLEMLEVLYEKQMDIPVILLTGFRDEKKMQRAWGACVYDFLDKPFSPENILIVADSALEFGREYVQTARKRFHRMGLHQKRKSA